MPHLPTLLLQVGVILVVARLLGWIFRKVHQPQVIGEMIAGILLGPSLLGWVAPNISAALFPVGSLGFLNALSQFGLLLFMFLVGLEFDPKILRGQGHTAIVTSHVSIIAPFFLGTLLSLFLYPRLSDASVTFTNFALFMGTAMSITAFPVLARILAERQMLRSKVGTVAIACAAVDDVTGWCILAGVVLVVRSTGGVMPLWLTLFGSVAFIGIMVFGVRRFLLRLEPIHGRAKEITPDIMALIFIMILASGLVTEWLGIHALFGAFLAGVIMPKQHGLADALAGRIEHVSTVLLLPLFFAFTGLRTSVGLVTGGEMWFYCGLIILVAVAGKFGGSALAARTTGVPWREASTVGILMNTRGLMELVVLNIGLDIGVLSPALFTMMVIMALVTTVMTAPLLQRVYFGSLSPCDSAKVTNEGMAAARDYA
jgi:Kef-type K+ transport system membrane component KefB